MKKIKPYEETHMEGQIEIQVYKEHGFLHPDLPVFDIIKKGDLGIQIAEDGRVWICVNGTSFLRFKPSGKYTTAGSKLL